ncbi:hypothetical protein NAT51_05160 [Flavobacterium amniphilum]|uniref:hypothetical protein n=1 Tax=Flavobacterium amniphilum TaxID=1834035 RepID=UPI00202A04D0|nr:hypothetical protein [Flavobacterium amniphilum]MCL9804897.1 hypothetical protein [Flavobacterium amniphilum]
MRTLIVILFFTISTSFFAQSNEIQALFEACSKDAVPDDFDYFNLVDSSFIMTFDRYDLDVVDDKEFLEKYKDFNPEEFAQKAKSTKKINWRQFNHPKARMYSFDSIPKFPCCMRNNIVVLSDEESVLKISFVAYNQLRIETGKNRSEEEINELAEAAWDHYEKSTAKEKKVYFKFSTPVFSENKKYALIKINNSGSGKYYVYKLENGLWKNIYRFGYWVG